jgi:hypothetical protein
MHDWKNCEHIVKAVRSSNWKCNQQKKKWLKDTILKSREFFFAIKKIIDTDILNDIKTEDCKKDNNDKKSDNEKSTEDDTSDIKFANITNLRSFKYASMFINKMFNNFL